MTLGDVKMLYVLSCIVLGLIILYPTLSMVVAFPNRERFSEFWLLGEDRQAENYPFNVSLDTVYKIYLEVENHMGESEYYRVYVKLRNQTEPAPNSLYGTPSVLNPLLENRLVLADEGVWETEVSFSFQDAFFQGNSCRVSKLILDSYEYSVDKMMIWDKNNTGFYCQLLFELWIYNRSISDFQFNNRFLGIWLNVSARAT